MIFHVRQQLEDDASVTLSLVIETDDRKTTLGGIEFTVNKPFTRAQLRVAVNQARQTILTNPATPDTSTVARLILEGVL